LFFIVNKVSTEVSLAFVGFTVFAFSKLSN